MIKRCSLFALCAVLVMSLCACGPKKANPDRYGYAVTQEDNGTYTISVAANGGGELYVRRQMSAEPQCLALTKDILQIVGDGQSGTQWTVFCNVTDDTVSTAFGNYVAANETKVAYVDYLTDAYQLFVRDIFDEGAYWEATTLTGLVVQKDGTLVKDVKVKNDQLIVTYQAATEDITITMAMPK